MLLLRVFILAIICNLTVNAKVTVSSPLDGSLILNNASFLDVTLDIDAALLVSDGNGYVPLTSMNIIYASGVFSQLISSNTSLFSSLVLKSTDSPNYKKCNTMAVNNGGIAMLQQSESGLVYHLTIRYNLTDCLVVGLPINM